MEEGWVKLHRSFVGWEWRDSPKHVSIFIDLLLSANHKSKKYHGIEIMPGELSTSYSAISKRTNISLQSVRTVLRDLQSTNEIICKNMQRFSLIKIKNWDKFQGNDKKTNTLSVATESEEKIKENNFSLNSSGDITPDSLIDLWNKYFPNRMRKGFGLGGGIHMQNYQLSIGHLTDLKDWEELFKKCKESDYLMGKTDKPTKWFSFTWIINYDNIQKVLEGRYNNSQENEIEIYNFED